MALGRMERILILAKTYPSPSAQYVETSCVAGISQDGSMRRLYPVPFRMIEEGQQFKKWQWIDVRIEKANKDHRPESHKLYVDTITCGDVIDTKKEWTGRWEWLDKIPAFESFDAIESGRLADGLSIALLRPKRQKRPSRAAALATCSADSSAARRVKTSSAACSADCWAATSSTQTSRGA